MPVWLWTSMSKIMRLPRQISIGASRTGLLEQPIHREYLNRMAVAAQEMAERVEGGGTGGSGGTGGLPARGELQEQRNGHSLPAQPQTEKPPQIHVPSRAGKPPVPPERVRA